MVKLAAGRFGHRVGSCSAFLSSNQDTRFSAGPQRRKWPGLNFRSPSRWWVYDVRYLLRSSCLQALVEEVGRVTPHRNSTAKIAASPLQLQILPKELRPGNSVSVSGVCLTALDIKPGSFCADLAPETWGTYVIFAHARGRSSEPGTSHEGRRRFGGHIVQGHVDGVGKLVALERIADSDNFWLRIELPRED